MRSSVTPRAARHLRGSVPTPFRRPGCRPCPTVSSSIVPKSRARARGKCSDWSSVDPHVGKSADWWRAANPSPNCPVVAADAVSRVRQVASALLRGMLAASGDAVSGTKLHPRPQAPPGLRDPRARRSAPGPAERPGPYLAAASLVTPRVRAQERRRRSLATPGGVRRGRSRRREVSSHGNGPSCSHASRWIRTGAGV